MTFEFEDFLKLRFSKVNENRFEVFYMQQGHKLEEVYNYLNKNIVQTSNEEVNIYANGYHLYLYANHVKQLESALLKGHVAKTMDELIYNEG